MKQISIKYRIMVLILSLLIGSSSVLPPTDACAQGTLSGNGHYVNIVSLTCTDNNYEYGANYLDYTFHATYIDAFGSRKTVDFPYSGDAGVYFSDVNGDGIRELVAYLDVSPEPLSHVEHKYFPIIYNITTEGVFEETTLQYVSFYEKAKDSFKDETANIRANAMVEERAAAQFVVDLAVLIQMRGIPEFRAEDLNGLAELYLINFNQLPTYGDSLLRVVADWYYGDAMDDDEYE